MASRLPDNTMARSFGRKEEQEVEGVMRLKETENHQRQKLMAQFVCSWRGEKLKSPPLTTGPGWPEKGGIGYGYGSGISRVSESESCREQNKSQ